MRQNRNKLFSFKKEVYQKQKQMVIRFLWSYGKNCVALNGMTLNSHNFMTQT